MEIPSSDYLKECFSYNHDTGLLCWKERPRKHFKSEKSHKTFNSQKAGKQCSQKLSDGYLRVKLDGVNYLQHRICYALAHGDFDHSLQIDHIDHNRINNAANNLRATNNLINGRNQSLKKTNKSGFNGVSWNVKYQRWQATISINGKTKHLGTFADKQDAVNARQTANHVFKFHQNHGVQSKKEAA